MYISVLLYCLLISNCISTQLTTRKRGEGVVWCAVNKCRLPFHSRAVIKNTPPLLCQYRVCGMLLDLDQECTTRFFFNETVPGLPILQGSATENRQQELLIHIFQCVPFYYIGKTTYHWAQNLPRSSTSEN